MRRLKYVLAVSLGLTFFVGVQPTRAKEKDFDFRDPKGVNSVSFLLDSTFEPIMGVASGISGTVTFDAKKPGNMTGSIIVETASLHHSNPGMTSKMKEPDWMGAAEYPTIEFTFKEVKEVEELDKNVHKLTVFGAITCKGVTKEMTIPITVTYLKGKLGKRLRGKRGDLLVLRSTFTIKRTDFGIKPKMSDTVVANDVEIRVSIVGAYTKEVAP